MKAARGVLLLTGPIATALPANARRKVAMMHLATPGNNVGLPVPSSTPPRETDASQMR